MARTDRRERVLGSNRLRWERQQQRPQRSGEYPDQADATSGKAVMRGSSGTSGNASG